MNNFKKYRIESGLTQNELSELLSIDQSTLSKYESNIRQPSFLVCSRFVKLLKLKGIEVNIDDIRKE